MDIQGQYGLVSAPLRQKEPALWRMSEHVKGGQGRDYTSHLAWEEELERVARGGTSSIF